MFSAVESELLSREAAKAVTEELSSGTILNETKVQVLYRILTTFTTEMNKDADNKEAGKKRSSQKKSYALLVPIIQSGLESASRLENFNKSSNGQGSDAEVCPDEDSAWLDPLWEKIIGLLAHLLTPVQTASYGSYMARSASLLDILKSVVSLMPMRKHDEMCSILSAGISSSIEVAQSQARIASDESATPEVKRKAKTRCEEARKVFEACFDGLCRLEPLSPTLYELTRTVLEDALQPRSAETPSGEKGLEKDVAVIVCKVIAKNAEMERLTIGIFSLLSKLISVDDDVLRKVAGGILGRVEVGQVLEEATRRCESAEERAQEAEEHIQELIDEIEDLREENESLHQQILVYSTSSALT